MKSTTTASAIIVLRVFLFLAFCAKNIAVSATSSEEGL